MEANLKFMFPDVFYCFSSIFTAYSAVADIKFFANLTKDNLLIKNSSLIEASITVYAED